MLTRAKFLSSFGLIILLVTADRVLKNIFISRPATSWWDGFLVQFNFAKNYGIAFGFNLPQWILASALFIALLILIIWLSYCWQKKQWVNALALWLIVCGALSNLLDRIQYGFVIDYIDVRFFTVLNIADVMITLGAVWLGWMLIMPKRKNIKELEF